jgi:hypothetical protein
MAEVSSDDALWRRFCPEGNDHQDHHTMRSSTPPDNSGFADSEDDDDGNETENGKKRHVWKTRYMEWLRPNLRQFVFAHSQQGTHRFPFYISPTAGRHCH